MKTKLTLLSAALLMCACGGEKVFTINGLAPEMADNTEVILMDIASETPLDTTVVTAGKFTFTMPATATPALMGVNNVRFLTDGDAVTLSYSKEESTATGTPLTEALQAFTSANVKFNKEVSAKMKEMAETYKEDPVKHREAYYKYFETVVAPTSDSMVKATFEGNELNPIGASLFTSAMKFDTMPEIEQIDAYYAKYPAAKNFKQIAKRRQQIINTENTQVGKQFSDFTIKNIENTAEAKLSDYVGKGKYVLVDFWASWCGPCKGEIPNLKAIQEKFGGDKFTVLGVNVWDKHDAAVEAVEEEGMTWPIIFDDNSRNSVATTTYGIGGIPTIILFSPEGKILNRTMRGEEMIEIVGEELAK